MSSCMRMEAIIPVDQTSTTFPMASVFDDLRGERDGLFVGRVEKFFSVEGGQE